MTFQYSEGPLQNFKAVNFPGLKVRVYNALGYTPAGGAWMVQFVPYRNNLPAYDEYADRGVDNSKNLVGSLSGESFDASNFTPVPLASMPSLAATPIGTFGWPRPNGPNNPMREGPFFDVDGNIIKAADRPAIGITMSPAPNVIAGLAKWSTHDRQVEFTGGLGEGQTVKLLVFYQHWPTLELTQPEFTAGPSETAVTLATKLANAVNSDSNAASVVTATASSSTVRFSVVNDGYPLSIFPGGNCPSLTDVGVITESAPSHNWSLWQGVTPGDVLSFIDPLSDE